MDELGTIRITGKIFITTGQPSNYFNKINQRVASPACTAKISSTYEFLAWTFSEGKSKTIHYNHNDSLSKVS